MLPTFFVVNPHSGKGDPKGVVSLIHEHFKDKGISYEVFVSGKRGDIPETAAAASKKFPIVVAAGGDGTVNEVANGLIGTSAAMGIVPVGSGNDFTKAVKYPSRPSDCLEVIARQKRLSIDAGYIKAIADDGDSRERYFVNAAGIGLDALVASRAANIGWVRGVTKYAIAASGVLFSYKPGISIAESHEFRSEGRHLLICVGNGICSGGGFYLTPHAKLDDGLFDVCMAKDLSTKQIMKILPFVFVGKHERFANIRMERTAAVKIRSEENLAVHLDGEILGLAFRQMEISVLRGGLDVVIP